MTINYAYEMDELLKPLEKFPTCDDFDDKTIKQWLSRIKKLVLQIQPKKSAYDRTWSFWIPIPTGSFKHYLQVTAKAEKMKPSELIDELRFEWECEYTEKSKWYRLGFSIGKGLSDFNLGFNEYFVMINKKGKLRGYPRFDSKQQYQLLDFIYDQLHQVVRAIVKNPKAYAKFLEKTLPKPYRFGRVKRFDYWRFIREKNRVDKVLGKKRIKQLEKILPELIEGALLPTMTANDYFRYCAIGYDANNYSHDINLPPVKKYRIMADMRDEGLTEIKGNSAKAFTGWYHKDRFGGHPWEICRGGNTTHISLRVTDVDQQWRLILSGSSYGRVVETTKMALALYEHGIKVQLSDAEAILHMMTGQDYIGLVPRGVPTRYCDEFFPEEDNIIDFEDPWLIEPADYKKIEPYIYWYPLETHVPVNQKLLSYA